MVDLGKMFGAGDVTTFLGFENVTPDGLLPGDLAFLGVPGATPYASVGPYCANAPKAVRGAAVDLIPEGADVLLTLDVDALDPAIMPGVIARTGGGMSFGEIIDLVDGVAAKARLCGVNMIEFMPERDIDGLGAMTAAQVMMHMMGRVSRQG